LGRLQRSPDHLAGFRSHTSKGRERGRESGVGKLKGEGKKEAKGKGRKERGRKGKRQALSTPDFESRVYA